jgi:hypothetical protein
LIRCLASFRLRRLGTRSRSGSWALVSAARVRRMARCKNVFGRIAAFSKVLGGEVGAPGTHVGRLTTPQEPRAIAGSRRSLQFPSSRACKVTSCPPPPAGSRPAPSARHSTVVRWGNLGWPQPGEFGWPSGSRYGRPRPKPRLVCAGVLSRFSTLPSRGAVIGRSPLQHSGRLDVLSFGLNEVGPI